MRRRTVSAVVALAGLAAAGLGVAPAYAAMPLGQIQTYTVPTSSAFPFGIVAGPDGNLWFTEEGAAKIGVISTAGSFLHEYTMPEGTSQPSGIAVGPNGELWFAEGGEDQIAEISTSDSLTEFEVSGDPDLDAITAGTDNAMWFPEGPGDANTIDRIPTSATSSNPDITKATIPTSNADADGIATDSGGDLWFTETGPDKVAELVPPDTFHEYPITGGYTFPGGIAAGPNDSMWFTEDNGGIAEVSASGSITEFPLPSPLGSSGPVPSPNSIAAGPDGNLWFTANVGDEADGWIGRLTPTGSVTYYAISGPPITGPDLARITAGPDGNMWFTEGDSNAIGVIGTASGGSSPLASVSPTSIPFGAGTVGVASTAQTVTVKNIGGASLTLGTITVTGTGMSGFVTSHDGCSDETVAARDSCTIDVAFDPPAAGSYTAQLSVPDDASGSPQTVALSGSAEPGAGLSGTLDFGQVDPGQTSAAQDETVTNTGGAALTIGTVSISGAQGGAFPIGTDGCSGQTVQPGGSCTVAVKFSPPAAGGYSAQLSVPDNVTGSPQTATVEGNSANPVALSPADVEFGAGTVGLTSPAQTVTLLASGTGSVTVSHVAVTGAQEGDFAITSDGCAGRTVSSGDTCVVAVDFTPAAAGSDSASLVFTDSADTSPQSVPLAGGSEPVVTVTSSLTFPAQPIGVASAPLGLSVFNTGQAPLDVASVAISGAQAGAFALSSDGCSGRAVAVGGSCSVAVTFTPQSGGSDSATLSMSDDAPASPQSVALAGSASPSSVTVTPTQLTFGDIAGGSMSTPATVTVTDAGPGKLAVAGVTLGGSGATAFRVSSDGCAGVSLPAGGACQVAVAYAPPAAGTYDATLSIDDDGAASPQQVALSGGASLSGHVYAADGGAPVPNADVEACQSPTCLSYVTTRTADDGSYELTRLTPGVWNVNVQPVTNVGDLTPGSAEVSIVAGQGVVQDFNLIAPEPLSGGVSVDVPGGVDTSGVPVITADTPFSLNVPVRIGPGPPDGERTFAFLASVGTAGTAGSAGGLVEGGAMMYTVRFSATGKPASISPIVVGALRCGSSSGTVSPCASIGGGTVHSALRQVAPPVATVADDCPAGGSGEPTPPGNFYIQPTANGGIEITDSGGSMTWDPIGFAQASPNGDPFHDVLVPSANLKAGTLNAAIGITIPPIGVYNTVVGVLSGGTQAFQTINQDGSAAGNSFIQAAVQIAVTAFGAVEGAPEKDSLYYAIALAAGDTSNVFVNTIGTVPGTQFGGLSFPAPVPCPGGTLGGGGGGGGGGSGGGSGGGGGAGGGSGGGSGGGGGGDILGGTAFIDPSGVVRTLSGVPIAGARVTLTRAATKRGRQRKVRSHSPNLSPQSPVNPEFTSLLGSFGWDVAPGFYQETATHPGCTPAVGRRNRSPVQVVPPPRTNAVLILRCPGLRRTPSRVRVHVIRDVIRGPLGSVVLQATVTASGSGADADARQRIAGTVTVRDGGLVLRMDPNPKTGLVIVDLLVPSKTRRKLTVSYAGDANLSPSTARVQLN